MGRAEKRAKERNARLTERKDKILLSRKELGLWKASVEQRTADYNVEALMTCFAMALHQEHMYSQEEIMEIFYKIDDLMGAVINEEKTIEDYKAEMRDAGIIVQAN